MKRREKLTTTGRLVSSWINHFCVCFVLCRYMKVPLAVCEDRDPKGLYRKVREGKIKGFTGIDAPYEEPSHPEITLDVHHAATGEEKSPQETAEELLNYLEANGFLESERGDLR